MRRWFILLLLLPLAGAQEELDVRVFHDLYATVESSEITVLAECPNTAMEVTDVGFRFYETTNEATDALAPGLGSKGCGRATFGVAIPGAADHFHLRMDASRTVTPAAAVLGPNNFVNVATFALNNDSMGSTWDRELFPANAGSTPMTTRDLPQVNLTGIGYLRVDLLFVEPLPTDGSQPLAAPSESYYEAEIRAPYLEFSGIPFVDPLIETETSQTGELSVTELRVQVTITDAMFNDFGVEFKGQAPAEFRPQFIISPSGEVFESFGTRTANNINGYNHDILLFETDTDGYNHLVVPRNVTETFGPGQYTMVFQRTVNVGPDDANLFLLGAVMVTPTLFGIPALVGSLRFRQRAVGQYVRISRTLINTVALLSLLYLILLLYVYLGRRDRVLAVNPTAPESLFLFAQVLLVAVAFFALWRLRIRYVVSEMESSLSEERDMQSTLRRSNQDLEMFASAASHDLREPLRMISSYSELLDRRIGGKLTEEETEFMSYIKSGSSRMQTLINDLLAYSRIDKPDQPPRPTDLTTVVDLVRIDLKSIMEQTGATVTAKDLPVVLAYPNLLRALVQNLVHNGIKFHGTRKPKVTISARKVPGALRVEVKDNGIGIEERYLKVVFEPFRRLHSRQAYAGAGIGLATCKKIVELHEGRLGAESTPGKGSTFWFELPEA